MHIRKQENLLLSQIINDSYKDQSLYYFRDDLKLYTVTILKNTRCDSLKKCITAPVT